MYDVVVLGAGLSGLSAAWLLRETGLNVLVLEARDRVGGRTHTVQSPQFGCTDVGGAYVGPTQTHILRLARELGLETYPVDHTQSSLLELQGTVRPFRGVIPPVYNPIGLLDLSNTMATVDKMASKIPRECPWEYPGAQELDSITAKELMERITWTGSTRNLLNIFIRSVFCVEAHEISALSLLWVITCGNGIERITNISGGAQERKFEAGAQAVSETLSERIGKERIRLGTPVLRVEQGAEHVRVISEDGQSFEGLYAISAIPHAILPTVHFHPPLPTLKRLLINRMPMGSVIKVVTFYKRAFWKEKGFNGCTMSNSGCVTFSMDDTKPDGSHPAMMGFIQAETARRMCLDTLERRKASVCQHYARIFKMEEFLHPVDYVEKNWTEEAYSGGCYSSTFGPGVLTSFGEALRQPVGRIHFAGTELASQWPGYMDGAVQSGERAAREVLRQLGRNGSEEISQAEASPPSDGVPTPEGGSWLARVLPTRHTLLHFGGVVLAAGLAWFFQSKRHLPLALSPQASIRVLSTWPHTGSGPSRSPGRRRRQSPPGTAQGGGCKPSPGSPREREGRLEEMQLRALLPALWVLLGLTEAGLQAPEEPGYPRTAGSTQRNLTAADVTGEGAKTNIIVAVFFIGMVTLLMTISLYCTLTRKGCGRYKWKKQVDEESLS